MEVIVTRDEFNRIYGKYGSIYDMPERFVMDAEPATPTQSGQVLCNTSCPNDGCKLHASTQSGECCIKCDDERAVRNGGIPVNNCGHCPCHAPKEEGKVLLQVEWPCEELEANGGCTCSSHKTITICENPLEKPRCAGCDCPFLAHQRIHTVQDRPGFYHTGCRPLSEPPQKVKPFSLDLAEGDIIHPAMPEISNYLNELARAVNFLLSRHTGEEGK